MVEVLSGCAVRAAIQMERATDDPAQHKTDEDRPLSLQNALKRSIRGLKD